MIFVLFHVLYFLGNFAIKKFQLYKNSNDNNEITKSYEPSSDEEASDLEFTSDDLYILKMMRKENLKRRYSGSEGENGDSNLRFSPPVYIQRYLAIQNILSSDERFAGKLKKVVEFGCAELKLFRYLKNINNVEEILFVDIDRQLLLLSKNHARPLHVDYLHTRKTPLVVNIFEGNVIHNDKVLENCDAIICIELIEHLYPDTLNKVPENIFGYIKPKVAIITTPNADFNVLFTNMTGFRHPDHKFEWSRQEFENWATNIVSKYPNYEVSFHGIGFGPEGTEHLGACSQMAVFYQKLQTNKENIQGVEGLFKLVEKIEYPYEIDTRTDEEKILGEAVYYINKFSGEESEMLEEVPLNLIVKFMKDYSISEEYLQEILTNNNWNVIEKDGVLFVVVPLPSEAFSNDSFMYDNMDIDFDETNEEEWGRTPVSNINWLNDSQENEDWNDEETQNLSNNSNNFESWENNQVRVNTNLVTGLEENQILNRSTINELEDVDENWDSDNSSKQSNLENLDNNTSNNQETENQELEITSISNNCLNTLSESKLSTGTESTENFHSIVEENLSVNETLSASSDYTSICSMFLEPSNISKNICLEDLSNCSSNPIDKSLDQNNDSLRLEENFVYPVAEKTFKVLPNCTSSPQEAESLKKNKEKLSSLSIPFNCDEFSVIETFDSEKKVGAGTASNNSNLLDISLTDNSNTILNMSSENNSYSKLNIENKDSSNNNSF